VQARRLERPNWVVACGAVLASEAESPAAALERAKAEARRNALQLFGVKVQAGCVDLQTLRGPSAGQLAECMVATGAQGTVAEERILDQGFEPLADGAFRRWVRLEVHVIEWSEAEKAGFEAHLSIGDRRVFRHGEPIQIRIESTHPARLYLMNVTEGGSTLLLPNPWAPNPEGAPGVPYVFPSEDLAERGIHFRVEALEGRPRSAETLLLVAVKDGQSLPGISRCQGFCSSEASGVARSVADFLRPLASLPPGSWTFAQASYEVIP
jgi:hypothetical protein